ncbi:DNA-3-methyladenine glycosylase 2 family protein [Affinibrenneria salicis]|uniref:DNA-3-methyladenine glycosylase II n=1 Tax=Affinibrenneria salicis TaxID=2590031 RepID=A0A5J5FRC0_9GAMM|nr:DNA-3-methyladenine glycosylase [Affinibrenneria salicis]KAA8994925.1 DNA-3-methyladenine glycosylase 2 family protein [Affinibrenneria salicis]
MTFFEYGDTELAWLSRRDKKMARAIEQFGRLLRPRTPDLFSALVRNIVDQQISVKAALTVNQRLGQLTGGVITPHALLLLDERQIQQCGMTMKKAGYIRQAAEAVFSGRLDLNALGAMDDASAIRALSSLSGVGVWTAEMLLLSSLNRPDILSWGDLAIRRGIMRLYRHSTLPRERFERYRRRYSPYGSTASLYLWEMSKLPVSGSDSL